MDAQRLKGMAVVALDDSTRLGRIEDLLFDPKTLQAVALQVRGDGPAFVIPFAEIKAIGTDAVTVESARVTQVASQGGTFSALPGLDALKKLKVIDENGTLLGLVSNVEIDEAAGRARTLSVHKGGLLGLGGQTTTLSAEAIRSVGPELITVAADAASTPKAQP